MAEKDQWIVEIQTTLGCINYNRVKAGSICRVPQKMKEAEALYGKGNTSHYRPRVVAMGPFHRATTITSDLFIMEEVKWCFMHNLFSRHKTDPETVEKTVEKTVKKCGKAIESLGSITRESYREKIEMESEELAKMMLLDASYFLEFLLKLDVKDNNNVHSSEKKKNVCALTDFMLLENQIPFFLIRTLSSKLLDVWNIVRAPHNLAPLLKLSDEVGQYSLRQISPRKLAELLGLRIDHVDSFEGVCHFLDLIHLCYRDPYQQQDVQRTPPQLQRCAKQLQYLGITIRPPQTNHAQGNDRTGIVADALKEFVDKFEFEIDFNKEQQELIIPVLHIKETTEIKWRNLIAWEQCALDEVGYKFTSYAHFFKCLASSCRDIKLLRDQKVIIAPKEVTNEDLLIIFQSLTIGAQKMDGRYMKTCKDLNEVNVNCAQSCGYMLRMSGHYILTSYEQCVRNLKYILIWFPQWLKRMFLSFRETYLSLPWKFIGVLAATTLLCLTIAQVIYAVRADNKSRN